MFNFLKNMFTGQDELVHVDESALLRQRNEERVKQAIESMGNKYLCHPDNQVKKLSKRQQKKLHGYYYGTMK